MLLPEAFQEPLAPQALLAFDQGSRDLLGGAAYHIRDGALILRYLRVVRFHRRRRVGSALIQQLTTIAREASLPAVRTHADTRDAPWLERFFAANGFANRGRMRIARINCQPALGVLLAMREKLKSSGRIPPSAQVVHPAEAPLEQAARMCADHMQSEWSVHPSYFRASVHRKESEYSFILMVDGRVAGLLIVEGAPGVDAARVIAHVLAPEYRRGWANIFLLATALERAAAAGVRSIRFETLERNIDTVNLIERFGGETLGVTTRFERRVTPP